MIGGILTAGGTLSAPQELEGHCLATLTRHHAAPDQAHITPQSCEQQRRDVDGTGSANDHEHQAFRNQQDPRLHSRIGRHMHLLRLPIPGPPVPAYRVVVRARAGGSERRSSFGGTLCVYSQPTGRIPGVRSGSCVRVRDGGGGKATRRWRSRRPSVGAIEPIWLLPAYLDGDQYRMYTTEITQDDLGHG